MADLLSTNPYPDNGGIYDYYTGVNPSLTGGNGGDSLTQSAEMNAQYNRGDMAWILTATVLVWIMIPGVGLLYSGLARKHSSGALLWQAMISISVVAVQWFFWGYSLAFSHTANSYIGDLHNIVSRQTLGRPSVGSALIPDILFYLYQLQFAAITGMLMLGGAMERGRLLPSAIFLFVFLISVFSISNKEAYKRNSWETIVYDPVACWTWNPQGWLYKLGGLDFAGGGPVHINSGAGALAYALVLGRRTGDFGGKMPHHKPGNVFFVLLGTVFLWFGWFGFNGGSALNISLRAIYAAANTNLAASSGALTWAVLDYFRKGGKWSIISLCTGAIAGLVGITPACGFVPLWSAIPIGAVAAFGANFAFDLKHYIGIDDGLDVFALHGVGGFIGSILTAFFAADYISALDGLSQEAGVEPPRGWLNGHYIQLGYQLAGSVTIFAYSFGVSYAILFAMDKVPFLRLRVDPAHEEKGLDELEVGEMLLEYGVYEVIEAGQRSLNEQRNAQRKDKEVQNSIDGQSINNPATEAEKQV